MKTQLAVGTRIYTTGDMANASGFGVVKSNDGSMVTMAMDDGRTISTVACGFSSVYKGHCGTRFVTEDAYKAWRNEKLAASGL